jgi:hypothetical protein
LPAGRPTALKPELIPIAEEAMAVGGTLALVAKACDVGLASIKRWLKAAEEGTGSDLENQFRAAIQKGRYAAHMRAVVAACAYREPKDAQWWLTHHPESRDDWSDAAAERRAVTAAMAAVAKGLEASGLSPEQLTHVITHIQAQGVPVPGTDAADG